MPAPRAMRPSNVHGPQLRPRLRGPLEDPGGTQTSVGPCALCADVSCKPLLGGRTRARRQGSLPGLGA